MKKILALTFMLGIAAGIFACGGGGSTADEPLENPGDTPTEAYKRLFAAVKSKNTEAIKAELSTKTHGFAESLAARQKKPIETVFSNGFTATTFAENLPELRDERLAEKMGALEVWNSTDKKWEDLPFIREKSGWKLAIGDVFANTYRSPGKGRDMIEREAANSMSPSNGMTQAPLGNANANFSSNSAPPASK